MTTITAGSGPTRCGDVTTGCNPVAPRSVLSL